jgi:hypothetical protein
VSAGAPWRLETVITRLVYANPWMRAREDSVRMPDGLRVYGVVDQPDHALVIPMAAGESNPVSAIGALARAVWRCQPVLIPEWPWLAGCTARVAGCL